MIIYTVLIVVIAIIGVLMGTVVLLQSGKGGGLAGIAGGSGGAAQLLGARQAPDILEKATWILATAFITLCILTNFFVETSETRQSIIQTQGQQVPAQTPAPAPTTPAPVSPGEGGTETPTQE
jgi:preprotein translocase subunit SecG